MKSPQEHLSNNFFKFSLFLTARQCCQSAPNRGGSRLTYKTSRSQSNFDGNPLKGGESFYRKTDNVIQKVHLPRLLVLVLPYRLHSLTNFAHSCLPMSLVRRHLRNICFCLLFTSAMLDLPHNRSHMKLRFNSICVLFVVKSRQIKVFL